MNENGKVPGVSIDEALQLFLALTFPQGIPEGEEGERIINTIKEQIAKDRPEWADVSNRASQASESPACNPHGAPANGYSTVKAQIVQQAQQEQIPDDPNERYFYQRDKEVRENREQRKLEERETQIRTDLFNRLQAQKNGTHETSLEKTLQIREALESRIRQTLQLTAGASVRENLLQHNKLGYTSGASSPPTATQQSSDLSLRHGQTQSHAKQEISMESQDSSAALPGNKFSGLNQDTLDEMNTEEKLDMLRDYASHKRSRLVSRKSLLGSRRPEKTESGMLQQKKTGRSSMDLSLDGEDKNGSSTSLSFSSRQAANKRRRSME